MYECTICLSLNHASRLHCQNCGAIPAMYSIMRETINCNGLRLAVAHGAVRAGQHPAQRVYLRTVALDYYANE